MSSEKVAGVHRTTPESDAPKSSEGKPTKVRSSAEAEQEDSENRTKKAKVDSAEADETSSEDEDESVDLDDENEDKIGVLDKDEDEEWESDRQKTPEPTSGPCTCRCGGCCCHGASSETPQHCVRCHTNYTFNHSQACTVPHMFAAGEVDFGDESPRDLAIRSLCCGSTVTCGVPIKGDWTQPFPCFIGWHTTDVDSVKDQYNGFNLLRCDPDDAGKCRRAQLRHHAHYQHLYDEKVKFSKVDGQDQKGHLKGKRNELGEGFEFTFGHVHRGEVMSAWKRARERGWY